MNIQVQTKSVIAKVRDHREYEDMIFRLSITLDCKDQETNSTIGYQFDHVFNTEVEYDDQNPFVPFNEITEEQIDNLVSKIIDEYRISGQKTILEWAEDRFNDIYSEPVYKPFSFQIPTEPVGVGTSP